MSRSRHSRSKPRLQRRRRRYVVEVGSKTYSDIRRRRRQHSRSHSKRRQRRSATRGWHEKAPKRGKERSTMLSRCGSSCFLDAKNKRYPICRRGTHEVLMLKTC